MRHLLVSLATLALLVTSGGAVGAQEESPDPEASPTPEQLAAAEERLATAQCLGKPATIVAIAGFETAGTPGADVIVGTAGDDVIRGEGGNDRICAGPGADLVEGGAGKDQIDGGLGSDQLDGGAGNDIINGGKGADMVTGAAGNDRLTGAAGNDTLDGGQGKDRCDGGPGHNRLPSCNEKFRTRGTLIITQNTKLKGPHKGNVHLFEDNVRLDCGGHTITGLGKQDTRLLAGIGIHFGQRRKVTVTDCHVTDFVVGMQNDGTRRTTIRNSSANGNHMGFAISALTRLSDNEAIDNDREGFSLAEGGNKLVGNVAEGNGIGFQIWSRGNKLSRNTASGNRERNYWLLESSRTTMNGNVSEGARVGFDLSFTDRSSLRDNRATGHREAGFALEGSKRNVLVGNVAEGGGRGFSLVAGSVGNELDGNLATNGSVGFHDESFGGKGIAGSRNEYADNTCPGNSTPSVPADLCDDNPPVEPEPSPEPSDRTDSERAPTAEE